MRSVIFAALLFGISGVASGGITLGEGRVFKHIKAGIGKYMAKKFTAKLPEDRRHDMRVMFKMWPLHEFDMTPEYAALTEYGTFSIDGDILRTWKEAKLDYLKRIGEEPPMDLKQDIHEPLEQADYKAPRE